VGRGDSERVLQAIDTHSCSEGFKVEVTRGRPHTNDSQSLDGGCRDDEAA